MPETSWQVSLTDLAHAERDELFLKVGRARGAEYARRWWDGLLSATDGLAEFPGPRSFPASIEESERRRVDVRRRVYRGPDRKNLDWVACTIVFAVFDPTQQDEGVGRISVLRYVGPRTQTAQEILTGGA